MNRVKHLTEEQLFGYAADSLEPSEENEVGRHLLLCADCRKLLPAPTPQQFLSVLLGETELPEQYHYFEESFSPRARFLAALPLLFGGRKLAWSAGGALILVAGFSFLIWRATVQPSEPLEIAPITVIENNPSETPIDENQISSSDEQVLKNEEIGSLTLSASPSEKLKNSPSPVIEQSAGKLNRNENVELARIIEDTPAAVLSLRPKDTAVLRSTSDDSELGQTFALINPVGETILETAPEFRWEKAAGAESYKITIFDADFNEVLTAEVFDNRFKPDKLLKPGAKYLWRVAAQTSSGEIIAPQLPQPPAMFRIAPETVAGQIKSFRKGKQFQLALFYTREGMLGSARCTLKTILAKAPKNYAARRLLIRVEQLQKENKIASNRCGFDSSSNADGL